MYNLLSLYIHIPWCVCKCPYCDFNSYSTNNDTIPETAYLSALLTDLEHDLPLVTGREIHSIFIGGGTPSLLSPDTIHTLLTEIRVRIPVSATAEITLEANPGTVDKPRLQAFRKAGITRLSLGIQSFNDITLQQIGRIHNRHTAIKAIEMAIAAGFTHFNVDLMFGLPDQTVTSALQDLQTAISFQPTHLSWYQLTLEPGTPFYHHPPILPDDDELWAIFSAGQTYLTENNYQHYEVSAYARTNYQCQHNLNYWQFGDYLGIGAGAHAKITDFTQGTITRFSKHRHPQTYLNAVLTRDMIAESTVLTEKEIFLEFMLNALRLYEGFTLEQFTTRTGLNPALLVTPLETGIKNDWLIQEGTRIRTTDRGMRFLNEVLMLFII